MAGTCSSSPLGAPQSETDDSNDDDGDDDDDDSDDDDDDDGNDGNNDDVLAANSHLTKYQNLLKLLSAEDVFERLE